MPEPWNTDVNDEYTFSPSSPPPPVGDPYPSAPPTSVPPQKKYLRRRPHGRSVSGVCDGLAHYFGTDVAPIRLLFVATVFMGGFGIIAYLIAWLAIPKASQWPTAGEAVSFNDWVRDAPQTTLAFILLGAILAMSTIDGVQGAAAGGLLLAVGIWILSQRSTQTATAPAPQSGFDYQPTADSWQPRPLPVETPMASQSAIPPFAIMVGLLTLVWGVFTLMAFLSVSAFPFWAAALTSILVIVGSVVVSLFLNNRRWPVVLFAMLTVPILGIMLAFSAGNLEIDLDTINVSPTEFAEVQSDYNFDAGEVVLDLSAIEFPPGETEIDLDIGLGSIEVLLPATVSHKVSADVGVGEMTLLGEFQEGLGLSASRGGSAIGLGPEAPTVILTVDVGVGSIQVDKIGA